MVAPPLNRRYLLDSPEVEVHVGEALPGDDTSEFGEVDPEGVDAEGDGEESVHCCDGHEAEVAAEVHKGGRGEKLGHFATAIKEGAESEDAVD